MGEIVKKTDQIFALEKNLTFGPKDFGGTPRLSQGVKDATEWQVGVGVDLKKVLDPFFDHFTLHRIKFNKISENKVSNKFFNTNKN